MIHFWCWMLILYRSPHSHFDAFPLITPIFSASREFGCFRIALGTWPRLRAARPGRPLAASLARGFRRNRLPFLSEVTL